MNVRVMKALFYLPFLIASFGVSGMDTENTAVSKMTTEKKAFFLALQTMSDEDATYTFMIDRMLERKCGRPPSIDALKEAGKTHLSFRKAFEAGHYADADKILQTLPCEK